MEETTITSANKTPPLSLAAKVGGQRVWNPQDARFLVLLSISNRKSRHGVLSTCPCEEESILSYMGKHRQ